METDDGSLEHQCGEGGAESGEGRLLHQLMEHLGKKDGDVTGNRGGGGGGLDGGDAFVEGGDDVEGDREAWREVAGDGNDHGVGVDYECAGVEGEDGELGDGLNGVDGVKHIADDVEQEVLGEGVELDKVQEGGVLLELSMFEMLDSVVGVGDTVIRRKVGRVGQGIEEVLL